MTTPRVRIGAYAFAVTDGALLLAQIADGYGHPGSWTLPGGGVDWGEDPEDGMHRELHEETGLRGSVRRLLGISSRVWGAESPRPMHSVQIVYEVEARGEPQVIDVDGSTSDARWIPLNRIDAISTVYLVRFAMERWSAG